MKNILVASLALILGVISTSCEDNKEEFLSDYSTILYLRNSGDQPLTLYKTGDETDYQIIISKAGSNQSAVTEADITVMDQNALDIYNADNGTTYVILPASCYQLGNTQLSFGSDETFKHVNVTFKTDLIYDLPPADYVLPVQLVNSQDSINPRKNEMVIFPTVVIPTVSLERTGYVNNVFTDASAELTKFTLPMSIPLISNWTFDCKVSIDQTLLDAFNIENETDFALLPKEAYSMSGDGVIAFTPGFDSRDLEITVNRTKVDYGNFVLPVRLTESTHSYINIDPKNNTCLYGISYVPDMSKLKDIALTAGILSSNAVEPSEGSLANLLDGDIETYFHSAWSVEVEGKHYVQVALPSEMTALAFKYTTRSTGGATPAEIIVSGSMDGATFSKIGILNEGLPTGAKATYNSAVMVGKPFRHLRFTVQKNLEGGAFFVWSEFSLKGI